MGCSSSSSSGTGHSIKEVKTQEQFSNQKNGVNNNPTEAVDRSQSVQASPVKMTNNDQTISYKQTTGNDKEKPSVKSDDFKLDYNEFKHIDEHARQVFITIIQLHCNAGWDLLCPLPYVEISS